MEDLLACFKFACLFEVHLFYELSLALTKNSLFRTKKHMYFTPENHQASKLCAKEV